MAPNRHRRLSVGEFRLRVYLATFGICFAITLIWTLLHG